jgi:NAD(P)-dependent dehydrogenase (short-subunit alcohol dehydrogenase family)
MLDGKVVIVTGAAGGLGRATAVAAADVGATVVMNDLGSDPSGEGADEEPLREAAAAIRDDGGDVRTSFGDVSDPEYVDAMVEETVEAEGKVDGVVNYAGFLRDGMSFKMEKADWDAVIDVHLSSHFNLVRSLGSQWRERFKADDIDTERSFVSVSSAAARGSASQINYSTAKAGVLGLTRTAARDLHRYDVRVNAIMPAAVTRAITANAPDEVVESLPVDELGPERVAPLPVGLLSDAAEGVTGWTFAIAGERVYTVTDPDFDRSALMKGGWTAEDLAESFDDLLAERPHAGLLSRLT